MKSTLLLQEQNFSQLLTVAALIGAARVSKRFLDTLTNF